MAAALISQTGTRPVQVAKTFSNRPTQLSARTVVHAVAFHKKFEVRAAAAEAEEAESVGGDANWAAERLAAMEASEQVQAEAAQFALNFLWLDKNIAVAVDQVFGKGHRSPVTEYFFWPRRDAWEDLKAALEGKPWVEEREKVLLLNRCTEVINFWQDENKHSLSEAQEKFPDCRFQGS